MEYSSEYLQMEFFLAYRFLSFRFHLTSCYSVLFCIPFNSINYAIAINFNPVIFIGLSHELLFPLVTNKFHKPLTHQF